MFKPVSAKLNVTEMEENILKFWKEEDIFKKTTTERVGKPEYVFYEGPPTANGKPGVHHVEARAFKDMFPRYKIMKGFHVSRRGGWDTHGLPVEIEVEKKHGFTNKQQIEDYGIDKFNQECRKSVFDYIQDWEKLTDRIAFWVDLKDAYVTFTNDYIESVWWILKNFWEKGLLYQGYKVVPYCPRCGTPLSDHEVAQGYAEAIDPSVFIRLPLVDDPSVSLLVWTTTPWTLPGNVAVAVHPDVEYVTIELDSIEGGKEKLILAKLLLDKVLREREYKVIKSFKGRELSHHKYQPLFTFVPPDKPAHYIVMGDFVTTEDGTGLVHIAPAFGADDLQVSKENDLPILMTVAADGSFIPEVTPWRGIFVKDADSMIIKDLQTRGLLFHAEKYTHTYPFCWRCDTPLLYYARRTWYLRTSQVKERLVEINRNNINWVPEQFKEGRFGNWLENNIDWALGRERFWGTPLPVWQCSNCNQQECIGSVEELSIKTSMDQSNLDLHRPYVDEIVWECSECEGTMHRVPELIDVWFDSGSMPVAQWHYPFENQEKFKQQFPADFICEAVDQTRGWFYSLHAISTMLFDSESYKNVVCLGLILNKNGQKMSKSRGTVNPWDVIDVSGADAFRWYFYTSGSPHAEKRFSTDMVTDIVKNFTLTLWNVYSFFVTYANLDNPKVKENFLPVNELDKWLLSTLNTLVKEVTLAYEEYDIPGATKPIEVFVENLSTWYLRRSRRRFWKSESDSDKHAAYNTLYTALVTLSKLLAPTMPFFAEEIHQNLVRNMKPSASESVHLEEWPTVHEYLIDEKLNDDMDLVMKMVSLGHSARQKANRKVRQPLSEVALSLRSIDEIEAVNVYADLISEELNVKSVRIMDTSSEAAAFKLKPLPKQLGQKYGNRFPLIFKAILSLDTDKTAKSLLAGDSIKIQVEGKDILINPDEVEVYAEAKEGYSVANDGPYMVALSTDLTPKLIQEGLAREFIRRVQDLRKKEELEISDRIDLYVDCYSGLRNAISEFVEYISVETLAINILFVLPMNGKEPSIEEFEGGSARILIQKRD